MKSKSVREFIVFWFKIYYKATESKTMWHWHNDRHRDQWNKIRSWEINFHIYNPFISQHRCQENSTGEMVFSANGDEIIGYPQEKEWSWTSISHHIQNRSETKI